MTKYLIKTVEFKKMYLFKHLNDIQVPFLNSIFN